MGYLILSINAGSSSLKTSLYDANQDDSQLRRLASAEISSINSPPSKLKYTRGSHKATSELKDVHDHTKAFEYVLDAFISDKDVPEVNSKEDITYTCHRVVHGGDFTTNELITRETFHKIEDLSDLAPLHNGSAVALMKACHDQISKVTNVACFDSAFHQTLPQYVRTYMIDQKVAKAKGLRKYGFHGLSYAYISRTVSRFLNKKPEQTSLIALHLGSGASACAIKNGESIDTSMGLTPVSGLPGGTRSGDVDPSLIFHYTSDAAQLSPSSTKELHISTAEEILNKQSGWKAIAGTSDFAEIAKSDATEDQKLALDIFVDRIVGFIGSYFVKLDGQVDALVFAGGIGEKSDVLRRLVIEKVKCLGFDVDDNKNKKPAEDDVADISSSDSKRKVLVCQTDEDYEMAYSTMLHPK